LLLIALGVAVAFRAGFFNVGAQGQMYVGAIASLSVGLWGDGRAPVLVIPLAILAGMVAGAAWSLISGWLRFAFGADEVVTSLMLNFIAILLLEWVASGPLKSGAGSGQAAVTRTLAPEYRISAATGVSATVVAICLFAVAVIWWFSQRTRVGLEVRVVGRNPIVARWQGVESTRIGALAFAVSGGMAGLAGAVEAFGPAGSLRAAFSPQVGFMAIVVALVGGLSALGILVAALFFGALRAATLYVPVVSDIPQSGIELINGLVALLITAAAVPPVWAFLRRRRSVLEQAGAPGPEPQPVPSRSAQ
jgi:general nucleoside transport system permease protein